MGWSIKFEVPVHRQLLSYFSPYFKAAFESGFAESKQEVFVLEGLSAITYQELLIWLYTGQFRGLESGESYWLLIELYVFADAYEFLALRRKIMSTLAQSKRIGLPVIMESVGGLSQVPTTSPLYQWCVETYINHWDPRYHHRKPTPKTPIDFFHDVARGHILKTLEGQSLPCKCCHDPCHWHEHLDEEEWEKNCHSHDATLSKPDPSTYRKPPRRS
ncbi:hypothetical protein E4T43_05541 [Aureobasidium subglaciale]|nr:hypothetical protein E4T43_05541 [Aureobasidium subglaciale]